jgi:hypothetical protein
MKQYSQRLAAVLLGAMAMAYQPLASAVSTTYGFYDISHNNLAAETDGEANLSVEVIDLNSSQVQFRFTNNSSSSLTDVYFDDGSLLGIASITSGAGVAFSQGGSPPDLPGGNTASPAFQTTSGFLADSDPAVSPNGVTQDEWLAITFNLISGKTYADTIAALNGASDLRIGVHVQSYPGGYSESFINNPTPVPEAETYGMMLVGLGLVGWAVRQRKLHA